jgi:hypothetical protein
MNSFQTTSQRDLTVAAAEIHKLIARFQDFAHCNRAVHITAGEAVAAYLALAELLALREQVVSFDDSEPYVEAPRILAH